MEQHARHSDRSVDAQRLLTHQWRIAAGCWVPGAGQRLTGGDATDHRGRRVERADSVCCPSRADSRRTERSYDCAEERIRATLLFSGGGVLQSRRTAEAGRKRNLRAASVLQARESSDAIEGNSCGTRAVELRRDGEEWRARRGCADRGGEEQLRIPVVRR